MTWTTKHYELDLTFFMFPLFLYFWFFQKRLTAIGCKISVARAEALMVCVLYVNTLKVCYTISNLKNLS